MTNGPSNIKIAATKTNANSASNKVIAIIDFPNERIFENDNVPPTEKVMKASPIFVTSVVLSTNDSGIIPVKRGFRKIPATMYPVTLGRPRRVQASPIIKPVNIMMPTIKIDSKLF